MTSEITYALPEYVRSKFHSELYKIVAEIYGSNLDGGLRLSTIRTKIFAIEYNSVREWLDFFFENGEIHLNLTLAIIF